MQNTEKTIIAIGVDTTTNEITYGGNKECHVHANDQVEWESEGPFAIQFLTTTPFTDSSFQSESIGVGKHGKKRIVRSVRRAPRSKAQDRLA